MTDLLAKNEIDGNTLIQYLEKINRLECSIFEQEQLYNNLENQIRILNQGYQKPYYQHETYRSESAFSFEGFFEFLPVAGGIGGLIGFFVGHFVMGILIGAGIYVALAIIISIIFDVLDGINNSQIRKLNKQIDKDNEQIAIENEQQKEYERAQIKLIREEQDRVRHSIIMTKQTLKQLYGVNIIYPKYRNMVAICTIYEYFCSKRCDKLGGHEGAYNLYESELRQNIIINQLDVIIRKLDQIIDNQYMLYQEIKESNIRAANICKQISGVAQSLNNISNNSEITAYYSKITAQNTEYLKWAELFKSV